MRGTRGTGCLAILAVLALAPSTSAQEPIHYCQGFSGEGWRVYDLSAPRSMKCGSMRKVARHWVNAGWCRLGSDCTMRVPKETGHRWTCGSHRFRGHWYQDCTRFQSTRPGYVTFNYVERRS